MEATLTVFSTVALRAQHTGNLRKHLGMECMNRLHMAKTICVARGAQNDKLSLLTYAYAFVGGLWEKWEF